MSVLIGRKQIYMSCHIADIAKRLQQRTTFCQNAKISSKQYLQKVPWRKNTRVCLSCIYKILLRVSYTTLVIIAASIDCFGCRKIRQKFICTYIKLNFIVRAKDIEIHLPSCWWMKFFVRHNMVVRILNTVYMPTLVNSCITNVRYTRVYTQLYMMTSS